MIYARDLAKQQLSYGNNVSMLMPGKYKEGASKSQISYFSKIDGLPVYQIINGIPFSTCGISNPKLFTNSITNNNYEKFLKEGKFDIVHIHSLIGFPKEIIEITNKLKIKTCFTSHDYFALCPKIYLINYKNEQCIDNNNGLDCVKCNMNINECLEIERRNKFFNLSYQLYNKASKILVKYRIYENVKRVIRKIGIKSLYIKNRLPDNIFTDQRNDEENDHTIYKYLREYHINILNKIDLFIFNSSVAFKEYEKYIDLSKRKYFIIPVTHNRIRNNYNDKPCDCSLKEIVHFGYMGYLNRIKGFYDLVETLNEILSNYTNWDIKIYGDYSGIDISTFDKNHFIFEGLYDHNRLTEIFAKIDMLIIPSKWKETFGFIGLEALSYCVPILASNNVGITDLIENEVTGIIYKDNFKNQELYTSIVNILNNPYKVNRYKVSLLKTSFSYGLEEHSKRLIELYLSLKCD